MPMPTVSTAARRLTPTAQRSDPVAHEQQRIERDILKRVIGYSTGSPRGWPTGNIALGCNSEAEAKELIRMIKRTIGPALAKQGITVTPDAIVPAKTLFPSQYLRIGFSIDPEKASEKLKTLIRRGAAAEARQLMTQITASGQPSGTFTRQIPSERSLPFYQSFLERQVQPLLAREGVRVTARSTVNAAGVVSATVTFSR